MGIVVFFILWIYNMEKYVVISYKMCYACWFTEQNNHSDKELIN